VTPPRPGLRLRSIGMIWVALAFGLGLGAALLWLGSANAWRAYLARAEIGGIATWESLRHGTTPPAGVIISPLPPELVALAETGAFARLPGAPQPAYVTQVSIRPDLPGTPAGEALSLAIVSDSLRYPVAALDAAGAHGAAEKFGRVTRLLASFCSEPVLFSRTPDGLWTRIDGRAVWGCGAAPGDYRLVGALGAVLALAGLLSHVARVTGGFEIFARSLMGRRRLGGPDSYEAEGPEELREIVAAVNAHLESERAALSQRLTVLSGVSHDLGTPATRLRLRTALIEDDALRARFETDIDRMTGMIESVLTYTRSELSVEVPRALSLSALLDALVADYQDMGRPVDLLPAEPIVVRGGRSLFMSRAGEGSLPEARRVLVVARPVSLQRAVSNLVDNALKYGRRAHVGLEAHADSAIITVEDEGPGDPAEIEALIAPFRRGANAATAEGFGLGLTIVAAVAEQHGGRLAFDRGARGLCARLEIARS